MISANDELLIPDEALRKLMATAFRKDLTEALGAGVEIPEYPEGE